MRWSSPHERCRVYRCTDCGTRTRPRRVLVNDNGRREVLDALHLRTLVVRHFVAKEQRIVRLPLTARLHGNRVERERRLAAPRHARKHNKLPLGNRQAHMLQVVLVSIGNSYIVNVMHGFCLSTICVISPPAVRLSESKRVSRACASSYSTNRNQPKVAFCAAIGRSLRWGSGRGREAYPQRRFCRRHSRRQVPYRLPSRRRG